MEKITKEKFDSMVTKGGSDFKNIILGLEIGEGVIIRKDEWKIKTIPSVYCGNYRKRGVFEVKTKTLADNSGWAILRIK